MTQAAPPDDARLRTPTGGSLRVRAERWRAQLSRRTTRGAAPVPAPAQEDPSPAEAAPRDSDPRAPVWAEGFVPLRITTAPPEEDLPDWMTAAQDTPTPDAEPAADAPDPDPAAGAVPPEEPAAVPAPPPPPGDHRFRTRPAARLLADVLLLAGAAVTVVLAREVYGDPDQRGIALTAAAAFATAVVSAVRSTLVLTRVAVRDGALQITRDGTVSSYDLGAETWPVELVVRPGRRGWRAVLTARGAPRTELTSLDVSPRAFTRVLEAHRPPQAAGTGTQ